MALRCAALAFALCAGRASAMECNEAVMKIGGFDTNCPKECSEDGEGGLPFCEGGKKEHTPGLCQTETCGVFISQFTDGMLENMIEALLQCSGDLEGFAQYGRMGVDYIKIMVIKQIVDDCQLPGEAFTATMPAPDTCMGGAYLTLMGLEQKCPKQCEEGGEDEEKRRRLEGGEDDELRQCEPGEPDRSPESCGSMQCGDHLATLDDATMAQAIQGLASCANHSMFGGYAIYATMNEGEYLKSVIRHWAGQCGLEDRLAMTPPSMDTCTGAWAVIQKLEMDCPKQCEDDPEDDNSEFRACGEDEPERTTDPTLGPSCQVPHCQRILAIVKSALGDIQMGLTDCATVEGYESLASYASIVEAHAMSLSSQCGYTYEDLPDPTTITIPPTPSSPSPAPRPTMCRSSLSIPRSVYSAAVAKGLQPKLCM